MDEKSRGCGGKLKLSYFVAPLCLAIKA